MSAELRDRIYTTSRDMTIRPERAAGFGQDLGSEKMAPVDGIYTSRDSTLDVSLGILVLKIGLALPAFDRDSSAPTTLVRLAEYAMRAEHVGYDSIWLMDHFWVEGEHGREAGHDPMVALAYIAGRVPGIQLGTLVVCNSFRHVAQLAREATALADASGGRFVLGLGAGWHEPEYTAFGLPFTEKVGRLEENLAAIPGLLRGERVTLAGRHIELRDANVMVSAPPPQIWIAAFGPRMMRLTARYADGWNAAWFGADPSRFRRGVERLWAELDSIGRPRSSMIVSAGLFVVPSGLDNRRSEKALCGDIDEIAAGFRAFEDAGAQRLVLSLATAPFRLDEPGYIEKVAKALDRSDS
jgi:alkanesulfonate monooxygenase SsuD/methylene tetrahydromethanopterin reductase-like flavin-dependent oxidoreductase (luciferase family)